MKKVLLGLSAVLLIVSSVIGMDVTDKTPHQMKHSSSSPVLSKMPKVEIRQRSNSLPAGSVILPEMDSRKLKFKKITTPDVFDKYKGVPEVESVKERLSEIADLDMKDPRRLLTLAGGIIKDYDERETLFGIMEDDISYIDTIIELIYERLLELGIWDVHFMASQFYTPCVSVSQTCAHSMTYDSESVSRKILSIAGQYIEAINWLRNDLERTRTAPSPIFTSIIDEIRHAKLPTTHYISWAIERALSNTTAQTTLIISQ